MVQTAHFESLYQRDGIQVGSWSCRPEHAGLSHEEWTPRYEVVFTRSGSFMKHVGRESTFANPNHVVFFNPGEAYRVSHPVAGGDECTVFLVTHSAMEELLSGCSCRLGKGAPRFAPQALADADSYYLHRLAFRGLKDAAVRFDSLAAEEITARLLQHVIPKGLGGADVTNGDGPPRALRHQRKAVESVKSLLADRFIDRLTLTDVAGATFYSKYHLARIFRREVGLSIHRYLSRLRLKAALERIMERDIDLSKLALELGFSSHSHFSQAFRREFGVTPSKARERASS